MEVLLHLVTALIPQAHAVSFNLALPGNIDTSVTPSPAGFIVNFYQFAMVLSGVLAFGVILYGSVLYSVSRGNPTKQGDAIDRLTQAFFGILLLVGAYAGLFVLNPGLTRLELPRLTKIEQVMVGEPAGDFEGGSSAPFFEEEADTPRGALPTTGGCAANRSQCVPVSSMGTTCSGAFCSQVVDQNVARVVKCIGEKTGLSMQTFDGYPPRGSHRDPRHANGCALDVVINSYQNCGQVTALRTALQQCGGTGMNEYLRCGGTKTPARKPGTQHDHYHINACY